jgi:hypothetical protein
MQSSKKSETDTTDNDKLAVSFDKILSSLIDISKKLPDKEKEFDAVTYLAKALKPADVLLSYKIIAHTKEGEIFNIEGVNNLPRLFDESMLPEAPNNFEQAFNSSIIRPVLNAFMKYTRDKIEDYKKASFPSPAQLTLQPNTQIDTQEFISD